MLTEAPGPLSSWSTTVTEQSDQAKCYYFSHPLSWNWDSVLFSNEFLTVPESPSPLLGRDILSKVQASVFINMEPALYIEQNVNPKVWADGKTVGWTQNAVPVVIKLKRPHLFPHQKQYPLKLKVKEVLWPVYSLGKTLLAFALLHSVLQGQTCLLLQVFLDFLLFLFFFFLKKGHAKECSNYRTVALISQASKVMLKILQARLQQYVNHEITVVQAGFTKGRGIGDKIANIPWIIEKAREF